MDFWSVDAVEFARLIVAWCWMLFTANVPDWFTAEQIGRWLDVMNGTRFAGEFWKDDGGWYAAPWARAVDDLLDFILIRGDH